VVCQLVVKETFNWMNVGMNVWLWVCEVENVEGFILYRGDICGRYEFEELKKFEEFEMKERAREKREITTSTYY